MPREHPDYRATIENLNIEFPGVQRLNMAQVMRATGYRSPNSVKAHYPMVNGHINKATLARLLCEGR